MRSDLNSDMYEVAVIWRGAVGGVEQSLWVIEFQVSNQLQILPKRRRAAFVRPLRRRDLV